MTELVNPYDQLARVYDVWVENYARELDPMRDFYVREILAADGPVAELGVGNGRILIAVAEKEKAITGIDLSAEMLALCRRNADVRGVSQYIELIQDDFREFTLAKPAALVAIPYEAIGHLLEVGEKRTCLENVYRQLRPGGRLILDQRTYDPELAANEHGLDRLAFTYDDPATGLPVRFWLHTEHDIGRMCWTTRSWLEWTDADGGSHTEVLGDLNSSNLERQDMEDLIIQAGFRVDDCLGDFVRQDPSDDTSDQQIWLAYRPQ